MRKILTHWLLPHHTNNHRPKALHVESLFAYVLLFAVFHVALGTGYRVFPNVLGYATDIHVTALLDATNEKRSEAGLTLLTLNDTLSQAAANKAVDMFSKNYWAHNSPEGKTPWDFIVGSGYRYTVAGENLAKNFSTSRNVVDAWMASPTHKENILKQSYRDVGFAVVNGILNGEETTLVVQMFGSSQRLQVQAPSSPAKAVEVPPVAATTPPPTVASAFASVSKKPLINIPTLSKDVSFAFLGILIGLLSVDALIVSRGRIVRLAGHNVAHMFFFSTVLVASTLAQRGSLL